MCSRNGGAFIKVGQHIGTLEYLLPPEYVQTMKIFHNEAPQSQLKDLYRVIEEDLGQKVTLLISIKTTRGLSQPFDCINKTHTRM